jgi:Ca2+-binding RTX toxin-like protein
MSGDARGGNDRLVSGTGDDQMWGDASSMAAGTVGGRDVFAFLFGSNGDDIVWDFEQGKDKIEIAGAPDGFAGLDIDETGGDSVIGMGGVNRITVKDVTDLTADDFLFVA